VPVNTGDFHFQQCDCPSFVLGQSRPKPWDFSLSQYQALAPKEENRMEITIFRRHIKRCSQKGDRYAPRCACPLSGQFNWPQSTTKFDGRKLKHGQNKWSLNAPDMVRGSAECHKA